MMVEARWPNIDVNNVGDASMATAAWRKVGDNTTYGTVHDPALRTNFSWDGALATLNVAHQWNTWTRIVSNHSRSAGTFDYPQDLPGLAGYDPLLYPAQAHIWDGCNQAKCNQYFLSGKLEALDAPGEWFHDGTTLYFYPPTTCTAPTAAVEIKTRDYAVQVGAKEGLSFEGLTFQGATLNLKNCTRCTLTNLTLDHPTYDREIRELNTPSTHVAATLVAGQHIALKNIVVTQSNNNGLLLNGYNVSLDNCFVSFTDWVGALQYKPLGVIGNQMSVTRCTVRDFGNAGVTTAIPNVAPAAPGKPQQPPEPMAGRRLEVAYTHIYNGARVGEDTAALYSGGWAAAGTVWHHNWVHDTTEKCIRFDDQSENATIHHNVIYNCGEPKFDASSGLNSGLGLVAKGDGHIIYANTIFAANFSEMCLSSCIEKEKPYRHQYPRILQNAHSQIFNTAAARAIPNKTHYGCECQAGGSPGGNFTAVYNGSDLRLVDVAAHDYRPTHDSPLVDAGVVWPPYTDGYVGAAPDIGAYEYGGERTAWVCGPRGAPHRRRRARAAADGAPHRVRAVRLEERQPVG